MIIQVRGTSGSGKSTVVRTVMDYCKDWKPHFKEGRRRPLYYQSNDPDWYSTTVVGHYEIAAGGCDTIGSAPKVFDLIMSMRSVKFILAEGLLLSEDVKWTTQMGSDVRCLFLNTDIDTCIDRIWRRQQEAGRNVDHSRRVTTSGVEETTKERVIRKATRRVKTIESARQRLTNQGVYCSRVSQKQAIRRLLQWLGIRD